MSAGMVGRAREVARGLFVCVLIALSAAYLASQYQTPVLLLALLLGMASAFLAEDARCRPGIDLAAGNVLRLGVALLGLRIVAGDVASLGWSTVAMLVTCAVLTIVSGIFFARLLGLDSKLGALSGGAVAICGVSAAIAISSVMPRNKAMDDHLALTIVMVTFFGSLAMVFFPALTQSLGMGTLHAGLFLGASIHDVSHVVGAGYSVSPEVGDIAVVTKMMRVIMLLPVVWCFFLAFRKDVQADNGGPAARLPWFLVVFAVLASLSTFGLVPDAVYGAADAVSRWCLVVAIVALGMKTSMRALIASGWRPAALVFGESALLGVLVLGWISLS